MKEINDKIVPKIQMVIKSQAKKLELEELSIKENSLAAKAKRANPKSLSNVIKDLPQNENNFSIIFITKKVKIGNEAK